MCSCWSCYVVPGEKWLHSTAGPCVTAVSCTRHQLHFALWSTESSLCSSFRPVVSCWSCQVSVNFTYRLLFKPYREETVLWRDCIVKWLLWSAVMFCCRLYGERVARHLDLDCSFVELIPKLYVNIPTEVRLTCLSVWRESKILWKSRHAELENCLGLNQWAWWVRRIDLRWFGHVGSDCVMIQVSGTIRRRRLRWTCCNCLTDDM